MMSIECPWCGARDENEFHYGGQAHVAYPADGGFSFTDAQWAEYLFVRDNTKGVFAERWVHSAGCRRWFNAVRDTETYEFLAIYRCGQPQPHVRRHRSVLDAEQVEQAPAPGVTA